jgi:hypothetical protein
MKITKRQLRRIIKEEKKKLLREQFTRASFDVSIETVGVNIDGDPTPLPADVNALAFDLEQHLAEWAQSVGVKVSVSADYQS